MFTKESLYINAVKYDTQLKLDYKKLNNEEIIDTDNSVFLVDNDLLPLDIAQKLNSSQEEIDNTYISTLLINDTTKLVPKAISAKLKDCEIAKFNNEFDIAVLKTTLFETKNYFVKTGIDYVYSAFHLINLHIDKNISRSEFIVFLFNSKAFIVILDAAGIIVHNTILDLACFDTIKKTHFYDDDIDGQKLFDEIYYLELNEIIHNTLNAFYEKKNNVFVEKVTILYVLKQLSQEQIEQLGEDLLLKVEYHPINIDEEIFELSRDKHLKKSFIKPRKKKKKRNYTNLYIFLFIVLVGFLAYQAYLKVDFNELFKKETVSEKTIDIQKIEDILELPDHLALNDQIEQRIKSIFETIPNEVYLKELKIEKNILELKGNFLNEGIFASALKPNLNKLYKEVVYSTSSSDKKVNIDGVILARNDIELNKTYKTYDKQYLTDEFMALDRVTEQLKILMPIDSIIKFNTTASNSTITRFVYSVNILVKDPREFFDMIEVLNNELYSIHIAYPISMLKTEAGIEIEFVLVFNQQNESKEEIKEEKEETK
ncbi:hypothetical protein CKA55_03045 [Arcobacter suis]|uniref:Membrane protein n=1 Tax=Arcobacter suis CECT 7833 TaxID=663365 RepID=A0AAD0WPK0_9BACT|nr:hypothetical protein [Arcobacter suis]AXX88830.1 putative membrane protein [Arcobacter suis CECT 7833]RWS47389.1 hypothetical protein CKA55_03045 [Arcobacter suis]